MSLTNEQKGQINNLIDYRNDIENALFQIDRILKDYFPKEYDIAYQHWLPQIHTALMNDDRWLPRGQFNMQQTLDRLLDQANGSKSNGVSRYI